MIRTIVLTLVILAAISVNVFGSTATFDDLSLPVSSYENGLNLASGFENGGIVLNNSYNIDWSSWSGFAYSNINNIIDGSYDNQYAAYTGSGFGGNGNYAVAYVSGFDGDAPMITLEDDTVICGLYITNTTYAALTIKNGNAFSKKFGGVSGNDVDYFKVTAIGKDESGIQTGTTDFYLADYRFANNSQDYVLNNWAWWNLNGLGTSTKTITFDLESSDSGLFGMNTPAYFAIDNVSAVPEPCSIIALFCGFAGLTAGALRRR